MKNKKSPKLRFPEFKQDGDWTTEKLGDIFSERKEVGFIHLPLLSLTDKDGIIPQDQTNRKNNSSVDKSKYLRIYPGDIVYNTMRMWEGRCAFVTLEGLVSPAYTVCEPKNGNEGLFFLYYFKTPKLISQFHRYSQGLVKDTLNLKYEAFSKILISRPQKKEQIKITDCLSSLDDLISGESQKLKALKEHKKSLMQDLFPSEGKNLPKLRFPEFDKNQEWEVKKLGEMTSKVGSGTTPLGGNSNYIQFGRPFVRSQNVGWGDFLLENIAFISEEMHKESISTEIKNGDVLLNITGASIGRSAVADKRVAGGNLNQHVCIIRTTDNELIPTFLNQYLISPYGQKQIENFQAGGNRQGLNFAQIRSFSITLPPSIKEQKRIANFLSVLDEIIKNQIVKIEQVKLHKKGLVQQLFPTNN